MYRKPYNKIRYPFLEASFPENPLPFKKLNRKGVKLNILSNRKGLTNRIRKIQESIIKQETVDKIYKKTILGKQDFVTVDNVETIHNFIKPSYQTSQSKESKERQVSLARLGLTKNKEYIMDKSRKSRFVISKYMFSLEQLKAEFHKKQSQYRKSSHFKSLLEERKKCSIIYGCLGEKQMQKLALQAKQFDGKFDENFIKIVESRLDVALFRICFFPTIFSAKQWINHKHILVNNSIVSLPGYQLKAGDVISISPQKRVLLKKKISSFIAEKIKIRSRHYHLRMDTFYTVIKNYISYQNNTNFITKNIDYTQNIRKLTLCIPYLKKTLYKIFKSVNKNKMYSSLYLLPKIFASFSRKREKLLPFLKVRNLFTSTRPSRQRVAGLRISGMKPLNLEVCYKNMVAIFLYSPQKVALPASLDLHLIAKTFQ